MPTDVERLVLQMSADLNRLEKNIARGAQAADRGAARIEQRFKRMNRSIARDFDVLGSSTGRALAALGSGLVLRQTAQMADAWTNLRNQLRQYQDVLGPVAQSQQRVVNIALAARAPLEALAQTTAAASRAARTLGADGESTFQAIEAIGKGAAIANTGTAAVEGALRQLGQAISSPRVQLEEFNSVIEGTPRLAKAFADGVTEAGGDVARLRTLISQGRVSGGDLFRALLTQLPRLREEFAQTESTIGGAFNNLRTRLIQYIGQQDAGIGASQRLVQAVQLLADNLDAVADAAIITGAVLASSFAGRNIEAGLSAAGRAITAARINAEAELNNLRNVYEETRNIRAAADVERAAARRRLDAALTEQTLARGELDDVRGAAPIRPAAPFQDRARPLADIQREEAEFAAAQARHADQVAAAERRVAAAERDVNAARADSLRASTAATQAAGRQAHASRQLTAALSTQATVQRAATQGVNLMRAAGSSLVSFLGGPWGAALTAAAVLLLVFKSNAEASAQAMATMERGLAAAARTTPVIVDAGDAMEDMAENTERLESAAEGAARNVRDQAGAHREATSAVDAQRRATEALLLAERQRAREEIRTGIRVGERNQRRLLRRLDEEEFFAERAFGRPGPEFEERRRRLNELRQDLLEVSNNLEILRTTERELTEGIRTFGAGTAETTTDASVSLTGPGAGGGGETVESLQRRAALALARLRHERDRVIALEDAEEVEDRTQAYVKAGLSAERARAVATREVVAERAELSRLDRESLELYRLQNELTLAQARHDTRRAEQLSDEIALRQEINQLLEEGLSHEQAKAEAAAFVRAQREAEVADRRARMDERELERQIDLAQREGDERRERSLQRRLDYLRRIRDLEDEGFTNESARSQAAREVQDVSDAEMRGRIREWVTGGIRASLEADLDEYVQNWWAERLTNAWERALNNVADLLFDVFNQILSQARGGSSSASAGGLLGVLGSIFSRNGPVTASVAGAAKAVVPKFSKATGGGLDAGLVYRVHKDETIVPRVPSYAVPAGAGGGAAVVYNDQRVFNLEGTGAEIAQMRAALAEDRQLLPMRIRATVGDMQQRGRLRSS